MIGDIWASLFGKITDVIGKAVPDAAKAQELTLSIMSVVSAESATQAALTSQDNISTSKFKSWWRPGLAWVCVIGFAIQYLIMPLAGMVIDHPFKSPLDVDSLNSMLYALLGLGGMRTAERIMGKA